MCVIVSVCYNNITVLSAVKHRSLHLDRPRDAEDTVESNFFCTNGTFWEGHHTHANASALGAAQHLLLSNKEIQSITLKKWTTAVRSPLQFAVPAFIRATCKAANSWQSVFLLPGCEQNAFNWVNWSCKYYCTETGFLKAFQLVAGRSSGLKLPTGTSLVTWRLICTLRSSAW